MTEAAPKQQDVTIQEINQRIWRHLEARDWHRNAPRSLAISLALEANELLEHYQWGDEPAGGVKEVSEELADVLIYAFEIAQVNNIDIAAAITHKLEKAALKYPAESFKGRTGKDQDEAWLKHKTQYKKEGL